MRMQENFSGCRVLAYCIMSNHFHILLEVPPAGALLLDDEGLLKRLLTVYSEAFVAEVAKELTEARSEENEEYVTEIYRRFTYRMHDLSEFMKTLLQRFTRWFNRTHDRTGTLWEQRYKSVIVADKLGKINWGRGLRIEFLISLSVHQLNRATVHCLECEALPLVASVHMTAKARDDASVNLLKEIKL